MARRRILMVEDDDALAALYGAALRLAGFEVEIAGDGLTALEDIDTDRPDLVVLELAMPQLGGRAILEEAAATPDTRDIPFIVLTTGDESAEGVSASAVLRKPCAPGALVDLVTRHLH